MPKDLVETYIYLAKRDKKGVRIIIDFLSQRHIPERLGSLSDFPIDVNISKKIEQIVFENRLNWEAWIESANNYEDLKAKLKKRGYIGIPMSPQPEIFTEAIVLNRVSNQRVMIQKTN